MAAEPAGADDDGPSWASGLLPPDGAAWPPEPVVQAPTPVPVEALPSTPRRPSDAAVDDWRSMPVDSPDGYRGSATAPPLPAERTETWSLVAAICATVGAAAYLGISVIGGAVLFMPLLAIAFGISGRRACSLDPTLRGTTMATLAVVAGVVEIVLPFALPGVFGLFD